MLGDYLKQREKEKEKKEKGERHAMLLSDYLITILLLHPQKMPSTLFEGDL